MRVYVRNRKLRRPGQAMLELPVMLIMLLFVFTFPCIIFATLGYRAILLWAATRSACQAAAKASTFGTAQTVAQAALNRQFSSGPQITINSQQLQIIAQPFPNTPGYPTFNYYTSPITGTINPGQYSYLVRYSVTGTLQPLLSDTVWVGTAVPGLTGPITLNIASENFFENPSGLNQ